MPPPQTPIQSKFENFKCLSIQENSKTPSLTQKSNISQILGTKLSSKTVSNFASIIGRGRVLDYPSKLNWPPVQKYILNNHMIYNEAFETVARTSGGIIWFFVFDFNLWLNINKFIESLELHNYS